MRLRTLLALAAFAAPLVVPCHADPLNPIYFSGTLQSGTQTEQITSYQYQNSQVSLTGAAGTATLSYALGGDSSLESLIDDPYPGSNQSLLSTLTLIYQFEVLGPTSATVPVNIYASGQVGYFSPTLGINGTLVDSATLAVGVAGDTPVIDQVVSTTGSTSFNINQPFYLSTNTIYSVAMITRTSFTSNITQPPSDFSAVAVLDPSITLATTDPEYSLEFSPGLFAPTPEPGSLVLAATGLVGLAEMLRRKSGRQASFSSEEAS